MSLNLVFYDTLTVNHPLSKNHFGFFPSPHSYPSGFLSNGTVHAKQILQIMRAKVKFVKVVWIPFFFSKLLAVLVCNCWCKVVYLDLFKMESYIVIPTILPNLTNESYTAPFLTFLIKYCIVLLSKFIWLT
jgi:hypothetical protein